MRSIRVYPAVTVGSRDDRRAPAAARLTDTAAGARPSGTRVGRGLRVRDRRLSAQGVRGRSVCEVESLFQASAMAKRLYVGNLAYSVTSDDLQEMFERFGTVRSAQVLSDRETGRSRGFGFVEMDNDDEAEAAIENLDGSDQQGRRLTVNEARP